MTVRLKTLRTRRSRRADDAHDRQHRERERQHDHDEDDVVEPIGVEPGDDAAADDDGERSLEAEAHEPEGGERDEKRFRLHLQRTGGQDEEREGERRRDEDERGERDRAC